MASYDIRSLADLSKQARGFFTGAIPGAVVSVWANTFTVFAKVLALLNFEHELRRKWLFKQMFASTADLLWLTRHGFELGLTLAPGTSAIGRVSLIATSGIVVPSGLVFVRADGLTYTSVGGTVSDSSGVTLFVEADLPGEGGNLEVGSTLTLSSDSDVPAGIGNLATVLASDDGSGLSGGTDEEEVEAFRARVLARKRNPPHGGAAPDYQAWVFEALPTARAVYVDSFVNDSRSIWVQFTVSDRPNGIPTDAQVAIAQDYVSDPVRRPVTARVFVSASTPVAVPVVIKGLAPDTPDIRASIAAELAAVFIDRAEPGKPSAAFVLDRSWIDEAISRAVGEDRHVLVSPAADLTFASGSLPVLGAISYTD